MSQARSLLLSMPTLILPILIRGGISNYAILHCTTIFDVFLLLASIFSKNILCSNILVFEEHIKSVVSFQRTLILAK